MRRGEERILEVPEVLDELIRFYVSAEVDMLCLQEVHRGDLAERTAHELGMYAGRTRSSEPWPGLRMW